MKASEAWRSIGEKIERERMVYRGLCFEVSTLADMEHIAYETRRAMINQVSNSMGFLDSRYAFPPGTHWQARCLAAYWLALEAEEEENRARSPRPRFDPEKVLALMYARVAAVKEATAKYEAASVVSQDVLDFEIRL